MEILTLISGNLSNAKRVAYIHLVLLAGTLSVSQNTHGYQVITRHLKLLALYKICKYSVHVFSAPKSQT